MPQDAPGSFARAFWSCSSFLEGLILIFSVTNQFSEIDVVDQKWGLKYLMFKLTILMSSELANWTNSNTTTLEKRKVRQKALRQLREHPDECTGVFGHPAEKIA